MCGRFALTESDMPLFDEFAATPSNDLPVLPNFNICPTNQVCSVVTIDGVRRMVAMRWGFLPHWYASEASGPLLINARAETLASKPAFRDACRKRRCLIPASGFFEWTRTADDRRLPWYASAKEGGPVAFGGIWQSWQNAGHVVDSLAIVTVPANNELEAIHHRAPLVIETTDYPLWLGEAGHGAARLMRPARDGYFCVHPVSSEVNSNRATGHKLIQPIERNARQDSAQ